MATPDLSGRRILLLGAETDLGAEIARALTAAGASMALVAASNHPQTAFAVQRLARKLGAPVSQAIDATSEMAVRIMVRHASKGLGGLDAVLLCGAPDERVREHARRFGEREMLRHGGGVFLEARGQTPEEALRRLLAALAAPPPSG